MKVRVGTNNETVRDAWVEGVLGRLPAGSRILDAGAGERRYRRSCLHLAYVAQDFARYDGKGDGRGLQTESWNRGGLDIVSDITAIPEPDGSFDAILCTEVLEHLPEPLRALEEFSRLLKGGGVLILTAPFCSLTHFAPYHFYSGFSRYFYETHLPTAGLRILEISENGNFFESIAQEILRLPYVAGRYAGDHPGRMEKTACRFVLRMLDRFSRGDRGSKELLHYGFHVLAEKATQG